MTRRPLAALIAILGVLAVVLAGCGGDDRPRDDVARDLPAGDEYENLLRECEVLQDPIIRDVVRGTSIQRGFYGAICRWVVSGNGVVDITYAWYEWGDFAFEKEISQELGFETENITLNVSGQTAFLQRDPARPRMCGVTAKAPGHGTATWWVEPHGGSVDGCDAATQLMDLILTGAL